MGKAEERWAVVWDIPTRGSLNSTSFPYAPISDAMSDIQDFAEQKKGGEIMFLEQTTPEIIGSVDAEHMMGCQKSRAS